MKFFLPGDVQTSEISQFPPVEQQIPVNSSSLVQSLFPRSLHLLVASSKFILSAGHLPGVSQIVPSSEQHLTPARYDFSWKEPTHAEPTAVHPSSTQSFNEIVIKYFIILLMIARK